MPAGNVQKLQSRSQRRPDPGSVPAVIAPGQTFTSITDQISGFILTRKSPLLWWAAFAFGIILSINLLTIVTLIFYRGVGLYGIQIPVGWGFAITNFVWWIGIGHAGTFISAMLLLARQKWRTSINRFAEAMTLFAAGVAGIFPVLHMGRAWFFYYLLPYPNVMELWPQWRSALVWDVFALSTYLLVSLLFWYIGLVPDLAT